MTNPRIPKLRDGSMKVAGWVEVQEAPWKVSDCCEWTYPSEMGDLTTFARNREEAAAALKAHGYVNVDKRKFRQTGGKLSDYLNKAIENK